MAERAVIERLRAGDKLHLQFVGGRRVWWFEAPHQAVPEAVVRQALEAGNVAEAGDSLFGLPLNSQTFLIGEGASVAVPPSPDHVSGDPGPHEYSPSWLHMGDCDICGNVADHPNHVRPKRQARDLFESEG